MTRLLATLLVSTVAATAALQPTPAAAEPRPGEPMRLAQSRAVPPVVEEDTISPRQVQQENRARTPRAARPAATSDGTPPRAARTGAPRTIACAGVFGRESTHLKLAMAFDSRNVVFTEVDGPENTKLNASVLFPNDPKRRLEVLWQNEATRSDTALIVVGGQSQWAGPKGLRLGMSLAALEKANGRPFALAGLDQDNGGSVLDWRGGAMASLPGDCKVGVRLAPDAKAKDDARAAVAGKELSSNDAALRPARLVVVEIIFGYSQ